MNLVTRTWKKLLYLLITGSTSVFIAACYGMPAGFAYLGEKVFILAIATQNQPEYQPLLEKAMNILVNEVPMPGTDCYGEVTLWINLPDRPEQIAQQRTSIPHLWTGTTAFLSVTALHQPERFMSQIPPIPK